jgi:hypothetical protein
MQMTFKLEKETKNYLKYRQEGGINAMYLPKNEDGATAAPPVLLVEVTVPA